MTSTSHSSSGQSPSGQPSHRALYVISVAADLAGLHAQTLRMWERRGLVEPARTGGGSRRYSDHDIALLRRIVELTNEGLNLAGVKAVLRLEAEKAALEEKLRKAQAAAERDRQRAAAAIEQARQADRGALVPVATATVVAYKSDR